MNRSCRPSAFELKVIVVPIDFSDTSHKALRYAVPFAAHFGASSSSFT